MSNQISVLFYRTLFLSCFQNSKINIWKIGVLLLWCTHTKSTKVSFASRISNMMFSDRFKIILEEFKTKSEGAILTRCRACFYSTVKRIKFFVLISSVSCFCSNFCFLGIVLCD